MKIKEYIDFIQKILMKYQANDILEYLNLIYRPNFVFITDQIELWKFIWIFFEIKEKFSHRLFHAGDQKESYLNIILKMYWITKIFSEKNFEYHCMFPWFLLDWKVDLQFKNFWLKDSLYFLLQIWRDLKYFHLNPFHNSRTMNRQLFPYDVSLENIWKLNLSIIIILEYSSLIFNFSM